MKKSDLIEMIAERNQLNKTQTQQVVEDVLEQIATALARGEKIDLRGFGTFSVRDSAALPFKIDVQDLPPRSYGAWTSADASFKS